MRSQNGSTKIQQFTNDELRILMLIKDKLDQRAQKEIEDALKERREYAEIGEYIGNAC